MTNAASARLALPMLEAGQAAKELTHNEALARLDLAVQASVVDVGLDEPPAQPFDGAAWIVGSTPGGAWTGHAGAIAGWTASGWRFVEAVEGMTVWVASAQLTAAYRSGEWSLGDLRCTSVRIDGVPVVGARAPAVAEPTGGTIVDPEAQGAIAEILAAMRHHGLIEA